MTTKPITITIYTNARFNLGRFVLGWGVIFGSISIGVVVGSPAMQWAGFIIAALTIFGLGANEAKRNSTLTIAQARKRLDEIEAEERA